MSKKPILFCWLVAALLVAGAPDAVADNLTGTNRFLC